MIIAVYEDTMGTAALSDENAQSAQLERLLDFYSPDEIPPEPSFVLRRIPYNITTGGAVLKPIHTHYEQFMMGCILLNTAFTLSKVYNITSLHQQVIDIQDIVFASVFLVDVLFKLLAVGPTFYFSKKWNTFDFVVVTSQTISFFVSSAAIVKVLRMLRICRLIKSSVQFRMLLSTLLASMGTILEILVLMMALMLSFAFIGMQAFDGVRHGVALNQHRNFEDFPNALHTLTTVCFGEWVFLLQDLEVQVPKCTEGYDCGSQGAGVYLMSFIVLTTFVMVNMVVAVILDAFTWLYSMETSRGNNSIGINELRKFKEVWQTYDVYSTGSIALKHLKSFVEEVGEPIGRSKCSHMWNQVLRAEVSAIPGSTMGEISFRNLFLILTTKMQGADAMCEDVNGEIKTNVDQVRSLGAVQAMFSNLMSQNAAPVAIRRTNSGCSRRLSDLTLTEKLARFKIAATKIEGSKLTKTAEVFDRESLCLKDKMQLYIREQAVHKAEKQGDEEALKATKDRLEQFRKGFKPIVVSSALDSGLQTAVRVARDSVHLGLGRQSQQLVHATQAIEKLQLEMNTKVESQLAVEQELQRMRVEGDAVKKQLQEKGEQQLAVEAELGIMRLERDAANDRLDRLALEMRSFQQFMGNHSLAPPPPPAPQPGARRLSTAWGGVTEGAQLSSKNLEAHSTPLELGRTRSEISLDNLLVTATEVINTP